MARCIAVLCIYNTHFFADFCVGYSDLTFFNHPQIRVINCKSGLRKLSHSSFNSPLKEKNAIGTVADAKMLIDVKHDRI